MLPLILELPEDRPLSVLAIGAHPDDIEIGAGGTLLSLAESRPGMSARYVVLTGTEERHSEARNAATVFLPDADLTIELHQLPEGRLPALWDCVKDVLEEWRETALPISFWRLHPTMPIRTTGSSERSCRPRSETSSFCRMKYRNGMEILGVLRSSFRSPPTWRIVRSSSFTSAFLRSPDAIGGTTRSFSGWPGSGAWSVERRTRRHSPAPSQCCSRWCRRMERLQSVKRRPVARVRADSGDDLVRGPRSFGSVPAAEHLSG